MKGGGKRGEGFPLRLLRIRTGGARPRRIRRRRRGGRREARRGGGARRTSPGGRTIPKSPGSRSRTRPRVESRRVILILLLSEAKPRFFFRSCNDSRARASRSGKETLMLRIEPRSGGESRRDEGGGSKFRLTLALIYQESGMNSARG